MILKHEHFMGRFEVKKPPTKNCAFYLENWVRRLIKSIGMELLNGPHLTYLKDPGNRGWTITCSIKTSHIAMHVWDESDPGVIQFDCYSCSHLDPQKLLEAMAEFDVVSAKWSFVDREDGLKLISSGEIYPDGARLETIHG
jgi:S-adenosylmethionine/arginine decarboxylase-like enzyme